MDFSSVGFSLRGLVQPEKNQQAEAHATTTGTLESNAASGMGGNISVAKYSRERVSVLAAGFHNFSGKTLSDFNGLGNTAPFRYQSRNVRTGPQVPSPFHGLYSDADGYFFNIRQMHLSFHDALRNAQRLWHTLCRRVG
jgi:hypothetical protein